MVGTPLYLWAISNRTQVKAGDTFRFTFRVTGTFGNVTAVTAYMTYDATRLRVDALDVSLDVMSYDMSSAYDNDAGTLDITATRLVAPFPSASFDLGYADFTYLRPAPAGSSLSDIIAFDDTAPRDSGVWIATLDWTSYPEGDRLMLSDMAIVCDRTRPAMKVRNDSRFSVVCPISGCSVRIARDAQAWIGHMRQSHGAYEWSWTDWRRRGTEWGLQDSRGGRQTYKMPKHLCYGCGQGFQTAATLLTHLEEVHQVTI